MTIFAYGLTQVPGDSLTCVTQNVVVATVFGLGIGTFLTFYEVPQMLGRILALIAWPILVLFMC